MPTYLCRATGLDATTMAALAAAITEAHADVTGAAGVFAQVLFEPLEPGRCFLAGRSLEGPHCFVHGHIRAGRSAKDRATLIERLVADCAEALGIAPDRVWVYLAELPPRAMAEYGRLLPEPGEEARWLAGLPEPTRERLRLDKPS